ncbi:hypothetical protein ACQY0O_004308 [Thecaphora frezii]
MEVSKAHDQIKDVAKKLLSHDPVVFNSTINAYFAAFSIYRGHGLHIEGASNLKHSAYLFNLFDAGKAAKIEHRDVHWDHSTTTAHIKATRYLRPRFFPLFQFAVPTEVTLKFHPSSPDTDSKDDKSQLLYCTSFEDRWPLDSLIRSLPIISFFYAHLFTPLATLFVLQLSNLVFALQTQLSSWDHRVLEPTTAAYGSKVEPRLPKGLKDGFEQGKSLAEGVGSQSIDFVLTLSHGPLRTVEVAAQTGTSIANAFLPKGLHLPYPNVFDEEEQGSKREKEGVLLFSDSNTSRRMSNSQMPEIRLSPSEEDPPCYRSVESHGEAEERQGQAEKSTPPSTDKQETDDANKDEEKHAKVVIGHPEEQGEGGQAREIDVVTHEVTEAKPETSDNGPSLYLQLKKEGELDEPLLAAERAAERAAEKASGDLSPQSSPKLGHSGDEEGSSKKTSGDGKSSSSNGGNSSSKKKKKGSNKGSKSKGSK